MPHPNQAVVVRHPEVDGVMVVLDPATDYASDDAFVKAYPQFFAPIVDPNRIIESVSIEAATAVPGEKRTRARSK
jgi:hypothetical protein